MHVLAVVSKAVFEKEARRGGKLVGVGDVWPTSLYASHNPNLEALGSGGSLFLVTVRPDDVLWLVGILESPKKDEKGWRAPANTTAVRDVSGLLPLLRFSTGKGVSAERGKLGMSLQTPRQLTDADVSLLRDDHSPTAATSDSDAATLAWRFDGYRSRARWTKLTAKEKALLDSFQGLLEQNDEDEGGVELVDVVDTVTGAPVALYALWPMSAGVLVDVASGAVLADVVESVFDAHGDDALRERMRAAHEAAAPRIHFAESVHYRGGTDTPRRALAPAATPDDPAVLAEIRALHTELDSRNETPTDVHETMRRVAVFGPKLFGEDVRPYPLRRPFDVTAAQRAYLELVADHYDNRLDLGSYGLPWKNARHEESNPGATSPLSRFVGRKPPLPLDATVDVDGQAHPLWAIVSDVLLGVRPQSTFLAALDAQPRELREGAWRQLAIGEDRLDGLPPRDKKEAQRGWADPKAQETHKARYAALLRETFARLDRAESIARDALAEPRPAHRTERTGSDRLCLAALDGLAQVAKKTGGVLDAKHDADIEALVRDELAPGDQLIALLRDLPPERAAALTGLHYQLLPLFPSESGLARVLEQMATHEDSQHPSGTWSKIATQLAGKVGESALAMLKEARPRLKRFPEGLDKAIVAAKKAGGKKGKR